MKQSVVENIRGPGLDRLLKLAEVAPLLGLSVRSVWREVQKGRLERPVPGKPARWFESDIQAYLKRLREERGSGVA